MTFLVTLKMEKTVDRRGTTVRLIGRVRAEDLLEVARQLEGSGPRAVLHLDEVTLVDVDVVRFLNRCETEGVRLVKMPTIHTRVDEQRAEPKPRVARALVGVRPRISCAVDQRAVTQPQ